jgi:hypothetical protein
LKKYGISMAIISKKSGIIGKIDKNTPNLMKLGYFIKSGGNACLPWTNAI